MGKTFKNIIINILICVTYIYSKISLDAGIVVSISLSPEPRAHVEYDLYKKF